MKVLVELGNYKVVIDNVEEKTLCRIISELGDSKETFEKDVSSLIRIAGNYCIVAEFTTENIEDYDYKIVYHCFDCKIYNHNDYLIGNAFNSNGTFSLKKSYLFKVVQFEYSHGHQPHKVRTIHVQNENSTAIEGIDLDKEDLTTDSYRKFLKSRIRGEINVLN